MVAVVIAMVLGINGCTGSGVERDGDGAKSSSPVPSPSEGLDLTDEFVQRIDGSTATIPLATAAMQALRGTAAGVEFNTTPDAYQNLINQEKDLIFVTAPSGDELAQAAAKGIELEVVPIVKDGLVFLVNEANPVDGLSGQQVQDIYSGQITNWSGVGGSDLGIVAYQRTVNSGSQTLFLQLAMADTTPMDAPIEIRPARMEDLINVVSAFDNSEQALGFSVFYYTQEMYVKDNVKLLAIDQITPSRQTIADGSYPYSSYYYAVLRSDEPAESPARQLLAWCLTDQAQQVFSTVNYVPLDQANIVEPDSTYGYLGSTVENTTQSSGTGGPAGVIPTSDPGPCVGGDGCSVTTDGSGKFQVEVSGYPHVAAAVAAWYEALPPADLPELTRAPERYLAWTDNFNPPVPTWANYDMSSIRGLVYAERAIWGEGFAGLIRADVVAFRLTDAHRMALSDYFYDGVNYIDFINSNLLNEGTNQCLVECLRRDGCRENQRMAPFTGLPATTTDFVMWPETNYEYAQTATLTFYFRPDNPFLVPNLDWGPPADILVDLYLPADLSPYGGIWRVDQAQLGGVTVDHIVSGVNGPDQRDDQINQQIDQFASQHPKGHHANVYTQTEPEGITLTVAMDQGSETKTFNYLTWPDRF